ncbi:CS1-pili formation C-terminal domain-containing protein [Erwinia oleae]|uniref:CS1-pili formation C-terminal domain-containing protein n=1 Tax=Erwinia oleae TaxID=796334 RepID=UPI000A050CB2|nr:CS1-pili formation C-terminal domain-containing protein [Erwinia oleae]
MLRNQFNVSYFHLVMVSLSACIPLKGNTAANNAAIDPVRIKNILIPGAFRQALQEGVAIPVMLSLEGNQTENNQKVANVMLVLHNAQFRIAQVETIENPQGAKLTEEITTQLAALKSVEFNNDLNIAVAPGATLHLDLKSLTIRLIVQKNALSRRERPRHTLLNAATVQDFTGTIAWDTGLYNSWHSHQQSNTNGYLSLNSLLSKGEDHFNVNGSVYGTDDKNYDAFLSRAIYERDVGGYRFATGMADSWDLQSLGNVSGINGGKVLGVSMGNHAASRNRIEGQSLIPIEVFLPAAGEVHIKRDGKLLSIQNFPMGSFEVDTRALPWGDYAVDVEIIVDGKRVSTTRQQLKKHFLRRGIGTPKLLWQTWGGLLKREGWQDSSSKTDDKTWIAGASASSQLSLWQVIDWTFSAWGFANVGVAESTLTMPLYENASITMQTLSATDRSTRAMLSGNVSINSQFSVWASHEKSTQGKSLSFDASNEFAVGGTLNLRRLLPKAGVVNVSYHRDRKHNNAWHNLDYSQSLFSGRYGNLSMRMGMQRYRYQNSDSSGKYLAFDFSMPLGKALGVGMSHQNGYTTANVSASQTHKEGIINATGVNIARAIGGDTGLDKTLSGSAYANFQAKQASGSLNVNSSARGYVNTNLVAHGETAFSGKNFAMSGANSGSGSGVIVETALTDGSLTARVNGQRFKIDGVNNYIPLSPYQHYQVELMNDRNSMASYDILKGRQQSFTLYPGNVVVMTPEVKQRVTVFGRLRSAQGQLLANTSVHNHIGKTVTDEQGEFSIDVDKLHPSIFISDASERLCESTLDLSGAQGVKWIGEIICENKAS